MSERWSYERLQSLFIQALYDRQIKQAARFLDEPDEHLPPAEFDEKAQEYGLVRLDPAARERWEREVEEASRKRAVQVLRAESTVELTDDSRARWKETRRALSELRESIKEAKEHVLRSPFKVEMWEKASWDERVQLEKRVVRVLAMYETRLDALKQAERHRDATGELPDVDDGTAPAPQADPVLDNNNVPKPVKYKRAFARLLIVEGQDGADWESAAPTRIYAEVSDAMGYESNAAKKYMGRNPDRFGFEETPTTRRLIEEAREWKAKHLRDKSGTDRGD